MGVTDTALSFDNPRRVLTLLGGEPFKIVEAEVFLVLRAHDEAAVALMSGQLVRPDDRRR